ncbi:TPA: uracil-DNA glycosylase [Thermoplasmata archaeon]|nr:uracil-DNA glycosylase [Thermoplasmata archaeon]
MKSRLRLSDCRRCRLFKERTKIVNGTGPVDAKVVFIGEAPGRDEDARGTPFVGMAGRILDQALSEAGATRDEVYVTNLVRCRPPGNRRPRKDELLACAEHLSEELSRMDPVVVCAMGQTVAKRLTPSAGRMADIDGTETELRIGQRRFRGLVTYHPAACLYRRSHIDSFKSAVRKCLELARRVEAE